MSISPQVCLCNAVKHIIIIVYELDCEEDSINVLGFRYISTNKVNRNLHFGSNLNLRRCPLTSISSLSTLKEGELLCQFECRVEQLSCSVSL